MAMVRVKVELGFIFYVYFVSTKPTALSDLVVCYCYTTGRWRLNKFSNKFEDPRAYLIATAKKEIGCRLDNFRGLLTILFLRPLPQLTT